MKYVAAYLLASLGGNAAPSKEDVAKILGSVGIDVDDSRVAMVVDELKGKSIEDVMAAGRTKLASVPSGGAVATGSSVAGGESKGEDKKEVKKEEKKVSEDEESDDDMGFGLFD